MSTFKRTDLRRDLSFLVIAGVLAGCYDQPTAPTSIARATDLSTFEVAQVERPFFYYGDKQILLELDTEHLILEGSDAELERVASEVLTSFGVQPRESKAPTKEHLELRVSRATSSESARALLSALKGDPRVKFATYGYRVAGTDVAIRLVNRINVEFLPTTSTRQIDSLSQSLGIAFLRRAQPDSGRFTYWFAYPRGATVDPLAIAAFLDRHALVASADPDKIAEISRHYVPTDPYYASQFHLRNSTIFNGVRVDINVEPAWDQNFGGGIPSAGGLTIAVIDDGVEASHPDLQGNVIHGYDVFGNNSIPCSDCANNPGGNYSHGTLAAGIIGARHNGAGVAGVAPAAWIYPVRIFSDAASATDAQIADGIDDAWFNAGAAVLSNSWGYTDPNYPGNNSVTNAISRANTNGRNGLGSVVVFSAGNTSNRQSGVVGGVAYPARLATVVAVSSINSSGAITNYAPEGPEIDIVAPSGHFTGQCLGEIVTTDLSGGRGCNDYPGDISYSATFSGTSASAPQVAGVVALVITSGTQLTGSQVKSRLSSGADPWGSATLYGSGKLNAGRSIVSGWSPMTVGITGPNTIRSNRTCTWWATVSGGSSPYSYSWSANGITIGENSAELTASFSSSRTLRVEVRDAGNYFAAADFSVTVSSNAPVCPL